VIRTVLISRSLQAEVLHSHGYKADIRWVRPRARARPW
jgi:hypothetical protein